MADPWDPATLSCCDHTSCSPPFEEQDLSTSLSGAPTPRSGQLLSAWRRPRKAASSGHRALGGAPASLQRSPTRGEALLCTVGGQVSRRMPQQPPGPAHAPWMAQRP